MENLSKSTEENNANIMLANSGLEHFLDEQKHAQQQVEKNEQILNELADEWETYPNGKPKIQFEGYGSHFR